MYFHINDTFLNAQCSLKVASINMTKKEPKDGCFHAFFSVFIIKSRHGNNTTKGKPQYGTHGILALIVP